MANEPDMKNIKRRVDFPDLLQEATEIWDEISPWWDEQIGDGNPAQDHLIEPTQLKLLDIKPGQRILDIACGAGRFTRRMAEAGAQVVAFDHSRSFIDIAKSKSRAYADRIDFRVANAADPPAIVELADEPFDAAVCTMAIMDMAMITPLAQTLPNVLKPGGRFVFTVLHPAFNSDGTRMSFEREFKAAGVNERYAISVPEYLRIHAWLGIGIKTQPRPHRYFHRPISDVLKVFLDAGMHLTAFEEPGFPPEVISGSSALAPLWSEFPLIMGVRLEVAR